MSPRVLRILLPLDGSADAEAVLAAVLPLAERRPLRLSLVTAVPDASARRAAKSYLEKAREVLQGPSIDTRSEVLLGDPVSVIVSRAITERSDLVAMATHGRSGVSRLLLGSVTEGVLRQAPVPLLTCRSGCRMEGWTHVVALDGSVRAEKVLEDIVPLTRLVGATLHLLHVVSGAGGRRVRDNERSRPGLDRLVASLASLGVSAVPVVRRGSPAAEIVRYASEQRAGLVALTTHGRRGLKRALMGSVAEEVLRHVSCPVVLRRDLREGSTVMPAFVTA